MVDTVDDQETVPYTYTAMKVVSLRRSPHRICTIWLVATVAFVQPSALHHNPATRQTVLHYAQLVWKDTRKVGCGKGKTTFPYEGVGLLQAVGAVPVVLLGRGVWHRCMCS